MSLLHTIQTEPVANVQLDPHVDVTADTSVRDVVARMQRLDRTTALVTHAGGLSGIFTERDVLQKVVTAPSNWDRPVGELMTPDPVVVSPETTLREAVRRMNEGHFRDLPVVDAGGRLHGNLTDNAIVRHLAEHLQAEVLNLPPVPDQVPKSVEGA